MKPLIQKLPLTESSSFVAQTFRTPNFEVGWHQHVEHELILFTEGSGLSFVGNHVGDFETGDIYLLGSNLPHSFQKSNPGLITSAVVVQFTDDFWGDNFLNIPETRSIKQLLETAKFGLKISPRSKDLLRPLIVQMEHERGFERLMLLFQCLQMISSQQDFTVVSTKEVNTITNQKGRENIDRIFQFTIDHFREEISLATVAGIACMSVPAFCNYFKKTTKKTYFDFLSEVRIGYACNLLLETKKSIQDISLESGYMNQVSFHRQFLKIKKLSPLQYRKQFTGRLAMPQRNIHIVSE